MLLLAKMFLLSLYFQNRVSDFDDFLQMLEIVALSDLASVLCARKFSFAPQGVDPKLLPFHFYLLLFYYLFIIIFEALRLVAAIFMFFF